MHGTCIKMKAYRILAGKCEGKGTPRGPTRSWEDIIKTDYHKIGRNDVDWPSDLE
jgi:hypothetical protein